MDAWKKMGRAKIPIKWISKDASRNLTFLKRKKGLKKKVEELSILCGVEACMVCFGPKTDQHTSQEQHLDVWPNMPKAIEVIERYRRLSKEEQDKKKLDNSSFLQQRINKLKSELNIKRKENGYLEMGTMYPCWDDGLNYLSVEKLRDLLEGIDLKLKAVGDRINFLTRTEHEISDNVGAENNIPFKEMEHIYRQPLMDPYRSQTTSIDYAHLVDGKSFPPVSDHDVHSNASLLGNYPGQWIPCCTVFSPCPEHCSMGSNGSQTATFPEFTVSCEPEQGQSQNGLLNVQNDHENMVKYEVRMNKKRKIESGSSWNSWSFDFHLTEQGCEN